jgi:rubrerythrin
VAADTQQQQKETTCVDANRLRRLAAEVDREHCAAMGGFRAELERTLDRRALVRRIGGFAVTIAGVSVAIPALATAAGAQQSTTTVGSQGASTTAGGAATTATTAPSAPTTTTTLPPSKPQPVDLAFLSFAQSVELAAVQAYGLALASTLLSADVAAVALAFQNHHRDHAQAFAGMAGKAATGVANQSLLTAFSPQFQTASTEAGILQATMAIETAAASTYTAGLAQIMGTDPAYLVGSILPIEARHAVVLGQALNLDLDAYSPVFETTANALSPAQYPIVEK